MSIEIGAAIVVTLLAVYAYHKKMIGKRGLKVIGAVEGLIAAFTQSKWLGGICTLVLASILIFKKGFSALKKLHRYYFFRRQAVTDPNDPNAIAQAEADFQRLVDQWLDWAGSLLFDRSHGPQQLPAPSESFLKRLWKAAKNLLWLTALIALGIILYRNPQIISWVEAQGWTSALVGIHIVGFVVLYFRSTAKERKPWNGIFVGRALKMGNGFVLGYILNILLLILEYYACKRISPEDHEFLFAFVGASSLAYFGFGGIQSIATGVKGAVTFLESWIKDPDLDDRAITWSNPDGTVGKEERPSYLVVDKGLYWIFPWPFGGMERLAIRPRVSVFGFTKPAKEFENPEDEETEKISLATGFTIYDKDGLPHKVFGSVTWIPEDVVELLVRKTKVVHQIVENMSQEEIKEDAAVMSSKELSSQTNEISSKTKKRIMDAMKTVATQHGFKVELVQITRVDPPKKLVDQKEEIEKERLEAEAEQVQATNRATIIGIIDEKVKNPKLSGLIAMADAGKLEWTYDDRPTDYNIKLDATGLPPGLQSVTAIPIPVSTGGNKNSNKNQPQKKGRGKNKQQEQQPKDKK